MPDLMSLLKRRNIFDPNQIEEEPDWKKRQTIFPSNSSLEEIESFSNNRVIFLCSAFLISLQPEDPGIFLSRNQS